MQVHKETEITTCIMLNEDETSLLQDILNGISKDDTNYKREIEKFKQKLWDQLNNPA